MSHALADATLLSPGRTLLIGIALSIGLHIAVVSGFLGQLKALFEAVTYMPPPRSEPLKARLIAPAPVIEREAAPAASRPGAAQAVGFGAPVAAAPATAAPLKPPKPPKPDLAAKQAKPAAKPKAEPEKIPVEKSAEPGPLATAPPVEPPEVERAAAPPDTPAPKVEPAPVKVKLSPFPLEAIVSFNVIGTDPKVTNPYHGSMRHHWREVVEGSSSRYIVKGEASVAFVASETMTSEGIINEKGLSPTRHERARSRREPEVINFTPGSQVAVVESRGEKRELKFAGDPVDMLSILYDLALDPGVAVGRTFAFARGITVYQFVLRTKGQQQVETGAGKLEALYFDFKRTEGEGQIEVWLALDKGLLPAKMRLVSSRGEEVEIIASKYEITKPR